MKKHKVLVLIKLVLITIIFVLIGSAIIRAMKEMREISMP